MKNLCKRSFDIAGALVGIALERYFIYKYGQALMKETGESLYFYQDRVGKDGKLFKICKLQTMNRAKDEEGNLLPESKRIGPLGAKLRRHCVDELPNFWNVLKGDMSIVGPRPHIPEEVFIAMDPERVTVKPGITYASKLKVGNSSHILENISDIAEIRKDKKRGAAATLLNDFAVCVRTAKRLFKGHSEEKTYYCLQGKSEHHPVEPKKQAKLAA
jgi:lipopolysaccharide/colanic/teichoic acid biosynthesis glycosyltransferase